MQTFDFEKRPIVPPYCLWVSGLLLVSGCREDGGLPRLYRVWQPGGNRPAMGEQAPGAWGAPGADPQQGWAASLASLWAGGNGGGTATGQSHGESAALRGPEFLLWGAMASTVLPARPAEAAAIPPMPPEAADGISIPPAGTPEVPREVSNGIRPEESCKTRIHFVPKPQPWNVPQAGGGKMLPIARPKSFCRKLVSFNPTPKPAR